MAVIDYIFRDLAMRYLGRNDLVHVKPEDLKSDAVHGEEKGEEPLLNMMEQTNSEQVVHSDGSVSSKTSSTKINLSSQDTFSKEKEVKMHTLQQNRQEARIKGYEGEACPDCGSFTLLRNGSCLKCDSCGSTFAKKDHLR